MELAFLVNLSAKSFIEKINKRIKLGRKLVTYHQGEMVKNIEGFSSNCSNEIEPELW